MEKREVPYELLIRWGADGSLSGGHYQFRSVYTDDGMVVADRIGDPVPVAIGDNDGFPIKDVLTAANLKPLAQVNAANTERDAQIARVEALETALAEAGSTVEALLQRISELTPASSIA